VPGTRQGRGLWLPDPRLLSLKSGHVNIPDILEAGINDDSAVFFLGAHKYVRLEPLFLSMKK
jgi:hypothetical protein